MKNKYLIILLILLIITNLYSVDKINTQAVYDKLIKGDVYIEYYGNHPDSDSNHKVLIYSTYNQQEHQSTYHFSIFKENILLYEYIPNSELYGYSFSFKDFTFFTFDNETVWVAFRWNIGAHSELFILLDPKNKKVIGEITASWPVSIEKCNNGIALTIPRDVNTEGKGTFELSYWGRNDVKKIIQVKNNSYEDDKVCDKLGY